MLTHTIEDTSLTLGALGVELHYCIDSAKDILDTLQQL